LEDTTPSCGTSPDIAQKNIWQVEEFLFRFKLRFNLATPPTIEMSDKKQQLVLSILDFLTESIKDGSVKADDKEGVEVAGKLL
jgi:hypothetical protein